MDLSLQEARLQRQPADQSDEPAVNLRPLEIIGDVSNAVTFPAILCLPNARIRAQS